MYRLIVVFAAVCFLCAGCNSQPSNVKPVVHSPEKIEAAKERAKASGKSSSLRGGDVTRGRDGASRSGGGR